MGVRWTVKSQEVHHSRASWVGEKPKDGGESLLLEMFRWIRKEKQAGKMIVHFGTGGSVSFAEFEQTERVPSPVAEFDVTDEPSI